MYFFNHYWADVPGGHSSKYPVIFNMRSLPAIKPTTTMSNDLEREKETIDGYLTTATITLIAGYLILFSITKFNSTIASWLAVSSLTCFILTLLFNFWYRYRKTYKTQLLKTKLDECLRNEIDVFVDYAELFEPTAKQKFIEIYQPALTSPIEGKIVDIQQTLKRPDLDEKFDKELKEVMLKNKSVLHSLIENFFNKIQGIRTEILKKPLKEKYYRVRFVLDILSYRTRYYLFCLGLALFLASIILNNLSLTVTTVTPK